MSGGVDSSVAAALLREAGHDVTGVTLKLWGGESDSGCCSVADVEDARRVAAQLDIPHYVFNFTDDFEAQRRRALRRARTRRARRPNPCVECNRTMKFGRLLDRATRWASTRSRPGTTRASSATADGRAGAARAAPTRPRTSRTSSTCSASDELARVRLPVGELTKAEVREHAHPARAAHRGQAGEHGRLLHHPRRHASASSRDRIGVRPGPIVDDAPARSSGSTTASTRSRSGSGAGSASRWASGASSSTSTPPRHRDDRADASELLRDGVDLRDLRFVDVGPPAADADLLVQVAGARRAGRRAGCEGDRVVFDAPQPRVAPGQVVALYDGDVLLGGGGIAAVSAREGGTGDGCVRQARGGPHKVPRRSTSLPRWPMTRPNETVGGTESRCSSPTTT